MAVQSPTQDFMPYRMRRVAAIEFLTMCVKKLSSLGKNNSPDTQCCIPAEHFEKITKSARDKRPV